MKPAALVKQNAELSDPAASLGCTAEQLADPWWRMCHLYTAVDKEGGVFTFTPNREQTELWSRWWFLNVILKARQIGATTFIILMMLDQCLFNDNFKAGIIAQGLTEGSELFRLKVREVYDRLPAAIRGLIGLKKENVQELVFTNGSSIAVGTSMRSGTLQFLLITEFGKIAAQFPKKAREIITGALNTVAAGQTIVIESTSEGAGGEFYEVVQQARALAQQRKKLTPLDFRFHFFPWWNRPEYRIDPTGVIVDANDTRYFEQLEASIDVAPGVPLRLDAGQRAWYVKKAQTQKGDMKREFPSHPDESFEVAVDGAWYAKELALIRRRNQVGDFPWIPGVVVNTFWDLGGSDETAIWFHQRVNRRDRMIGYYENSGEGLAHYVLYLQQTGYTFGKHYLPHDVDARVLTETLETKYDILERLGVTNMEVVPRVKNITDGIESTRMMLPLLDFNEEECSTGLKALAGYTKTWNDTLGRWSDQPLHNWASNGADALRQMGQVYTMIGNNSALVSKKNHTDDVYEAEAKKRKKMGRGRSFRAV